MAYTLEIPNGAELQRRLEVVKYLESEMTQPVGVQWDTTATSPALQRIDINGDNLNVFSSFFNHHVTWNLQRFVRNRATGTMQTTSVLDGTAGDVLVRYPTDRWAYAEDGDFLQLFSIPYYTSSTEYEVHPFVVQHGGTERPFIYLGAKEAYGYLDSGTFKLGSASGKQPITGGVAYPDCPNSGRFTIDDAITYANNIGSGFWPCNPWTYADIKLRIAIEYGTWDIPTELGLGVTNLAAGTTTFGGRLTGADDIDNHLGSNGTGMGTGINGETPICWRYLENPYGNAFEFMTGMNMFASSGTDGEGHTYTAGECRVLKAAGTGAPAGTLTYGDYLIAPGVVPIGADNFISGIQTGKTGRQLFLPSAVNGLDSTGLSDIFYYPRYNPSVVLHGGYWANSLNAGPFCMYAYAPVTYSHRMVGCRLEYYPPLS